MRPVKKSQRIKICDKCISCYRQATERHHPLKYARNNHEIDEISVPLCTDCHRGNFGDIFKEVKIKCEIKAIEDNLEYLEKNYNKFNWSQRLKYLKTL